MMVMKNQAKRWSKLKPFPAEERNSVVSIEDPKAFLAKPWATTDFGILCG